MEKKRRAAIQLGSEATRQVPTGGNGRVGKGGFRQAGAIALAMLDEIRKRRDTKE